MPPPATLFAALPDRELIAEQGWQVIRAAPTGDSPEAQRRLLEWIRLFAVPTETTDGVFVWPVCPRPPREDATFSETRDTAALHTDSQFRDAPEEAFALLCVRPADEGGASLVQPVLPLVEHVQASDPDAFELLCRSPVPFLAPAAFADDGLSWHRVIDSGNVTWRWDTLEAGLRRAGQVAPEVRAALCVFRDAVESSRPAELMLEEGDLLLVDNKHCLHGRTAFRGDRLLYRVRFNWM
jgi:alpha-ketoglutarate-dependent taurine dioxygenase